MAASSRTRTSQEPSPRALDPDEQRQLLALAESLGLECRALAFMATTTPLDIRELTVRAAALDLQLEPDGTSSLLGHEMRRWRLVDVNTCDTLVTEGILEERLSLGDVAGALDYWEAVS